MTTYACPSCPSSAFCSCGFTVGVVEPVRTVSASPPPETLQGLLSSEVIKAIDRQTAMLKAVLEALMPTPPDPLIAHAREAWTGAERRLAEEKAGTSSLPRRPGRGRRPSVRERVSREGEPA